MSLNLQSVRVKQRKCCALCSKMEFTTPPDMYANELQNPNVINHSHKCVICGWAIEDTSDGVSISWDSEPGNKILLNGTGGISESIQNKFLNGYWTHRHCLE